MPNALNAIAALVPLFLAAAGASGLSPLPRPALLLDARVRKVPELGRFGGKAVTAVPESPRSFNLFVSEDGATTAAGLMLFSTLYSYDNELQRSENDLALSDSVSADGLSWVIRLLPARFSDGSPILASDVVASVEAVYDTSAHSTLLDALMFGGRRMEIRASGPHQLRIRLAALSPNFRDLIGSVPILPGRILGPLRAGHNLASSFGLDTSPESLVCSGPWRLGKYVPGERVEFLRNPWCHYQDSRARRLPYLDALTWLFIADPNARMLRFESGDLDFLEEPSASAYDRLVSASAGGGARVFDLGPSLNPTLVWFNLNPPTSAHLARPRTALLGDIRFREAVAAAIQPAALMRVVYQGRASESPGFYSQGVRQWVDSRLAAARADPARAKRILGELGFLDRDGDGILEDARGEKLELHMVLNAGKPNMPQVAVRLREDLRRVGILLQVAPLEVGQFLAAIERNFDYDLGLTTMTQPIPPNPSQARNFWCSSGPSHLWRMKEPRPAEAWEAQVDSLFELEERTLSLSGRKRAMDRMQEILAAQHVCVFLPVPREFSLARRTLGNLRPSPLPWHLTWNAQDLFLRN